MDKKLLKKFRRYLELSIKFEKYPQEIFQDIPTKSNNNHCIVYSGDAIGVNITGMSSGTSLTSTESKNYKVETRAEKIMNAAKENAKLANEYDEYKELQNSLSKFLTAEKQL
jgi:hypothetical protein